MNKDVSEPSVRTASGMAENLSRFMGREFRGIPMALVACAVAAILLGCLLALTTVRH
jgi:TRAP-type mannitol/chloroaromatic compound transport system permease large subunit